MLVNYLLLCKKNEKISKKFFPSWLVYWPGFSSTKEVLTFTIKT